MSVLPSSYTSLSKGFKLSWDMYHAAVFISALVDASWAAHVLT